MAENLPSKSTLPIAADPLLRCTAPRENWVLFFRAHSQLTGGNGKAQNSWTEILAELRMPLSAYLRILFGMQGIYCQALRGSYVSSDGIEVEMVGHLPPPREQCVIREWSWSIQYWDSLTPLFNKII